MSEKTASMKRVATASYIGALVEWYDFNLYGLAAALILNELFFPTLDPLTGVIAAFASFGAGFIIRPVGALVFGHLGDKIGRKKILIYSLVIMGGATFSIGLIPTYGTIGIWAPILLVVLRLIQGFALGGEYGGAALLTIEHSPRDKRGFWGGLLQSSTAAGLLLATLVISLVAMLPDKHLLTWGWRVPFLISIVLLVVGVFIRLKISETPSFEKMKKDKDEAKYPIVDLVRSYPNTLIKSMGIRIGEAVAYNIVNIYAISYIVSILELPRSQATIGVVLGATLTIILSPVFGKISDHIGRRKVYMASALFLVLASFPFFYLLNTKNMLIIWITMALFYVFGSAMMLSIQSVMFTELLPVKIRYTGLSVIYQVTSAIAGMTPLFATVLLGYSNNKPWLVATFVCLTGVITLISSYRTKETYKLDQSEIELKFLEEEAKRKV